jgi:hypothetical protein
MVLDVFVESIMLSVAIVFRVVALSVLVMVLAVVIGAAAECWEDYRKGES